MVRIPLSPCNFLELYPHGKLNVCGLAPARSTIPYTIGITPMTPSWRGTKRWPLYVPMRGDTSLSLECPDHSKIIKLRWFWLHKDPTEPFKIHRGWWLSTPDNSFSLCKWREKRVTHILLRNQQSSPIFSKKIQMSLLSQKSDLMNKSQKTIRFWCVAYIDCPFLLQNRSHICWN